PADCPSCAQMKAWYGADQGRATSRCPVSAPPPAEPDDALSVLAELVAVYTKPVTQMGAEEWRTLDETWARAKALTSRADHGGGEAEALARSDVIRDAPPVGDTAPEPAEDEEPDTCCCGRPVSDHWQACLDAGAGGWKCDDRGFRLVDRPVPAPGTGPAEPAEEPEFATTEQLHVKRRAVLDRLPTGTRMALDDVDFLLGFWPPVASRPSGGGEAAPDDAVERCAEAAYREWYRVESWDRAQPAQRDEWRRVARAVLRTAGETDG
ncbi:MAG: hypothetical protein M3N43_06965, partial [Actinomycetota bacterium]|nr:hypothetical protein [Actinomycetota bacterium]